MVDAGDILPLLAGEAESHILEDSVVRKKGAFLWDVADGSAVGGDKAGAAVSELTVTKVDGSPVNGYEAKYRAQQGRLAAS